MANPIHEMLRAQAVEFEPWGEAQIARKYGDVELERKNAQEFAGLLDQSMLGIVSVAGEDQCRFLHRLTTNDMMGLHPGGGTETVFVTAKGRMLFHVLAYRRESDILLVNREPGTAGLLQLLSKYHFGERVEYRDAMDDLAVLTVLGPQSYSVIHELTGVNLSGSSLHATEISQVDGGALLVAPTFPVAGSAVNLILPVDTLVSTWKKLTALGVTPIGREAYNDLRITSGIPEPMSELTENFNPLESGLWSAVHFEKGCYVGQEVIARLNTYEKVSKNLMRLALQVGAGALVGARIVVERNSVGVVTSVTRAATEGEYRALGYVRKGYQETGTGFTAATDAGESRGRVLGPGA